MTDSVHLPSFRDYTVVSRLGHGGFGTVYKAQHNYTKQLRAIKILPPGIQSDTDTLRQFQDEAEAMGAVDHPHIVKIYHAGIENGFPFLDMEFIEGESVYDLIQRQVAAGDRPMPVGEVIRLGREIADALAYIHSKDLIHRDIKPQNIIRRTADQVFKLTDFGIAFESKLSTRSTDMAGTAEYMSPEQIEGERLTNGTDIYSLGVVLYECLIGRVPFHSEGNSFSSRLKLQQQILEKIPLHVRDYNTDAPDWFADIVMKCLSKKAEDRFVSAAGLVNAIDAGIESEKADAVATMTQAAKDVSRNLYEEATTLYREARGQFERITTYITAQSNMMPALRASIADCSERIEFLSERGQKVKSLREQGSYLMAQQDFKKALGVYQEILGIYGGDTDATRLIQRCEEGIREQENQRQARIKALRQTAQATFQEQKYRDARQAWLDLGSIAPEFAQEAEQNAKVLNDELSKYWKRHYDKEREADNLVAEAQKTYFNEPAHRQIVALYKEAQQLAELGFDSDVNVYRKRNNALQEKVVTANQLLAEFRTNMQNLRSEADRLFAAGQYTEAKKRYQQVMDALPEDKTLPDRIVECTNNEIRVLREGADRLFVDEDYEKAATLYKGLLELSPKDAEAQKRLSECENFLRVAQQMKELQDQQVELLLKTGDQLASVGSYKAALDKYQQALAIHPDNEAVKTKIEVTSPLVQQSSGTASRLFGGFLRSSGKQTPPPPPAPPAPKSQVQPVQPQKPAPLPVQPAPIKPAPVQPKPAPAPVKMTPPPAPAPKPAPQPQAPKPAPVAQAPKPAPAPVKPAPPQAQKMTPQPQAAKPNVPAPKPAPLPPKRPTPTPEVREIPKNVPAAVAAIEAESESSRRWILPAIIGGIALIALAFIVIQDPFGFMGSDSANVFKVGADGNSATNGIGMTFVKIPAGSFSMGDPNGEADARPAHTVNLTHPFWMSEKEVTVAQFNQFKNETGYTTEAEKSGTCDIWQNENWITDQTGAWKTFSNSDDAPVVCVSWNDAQEFVAWLNTKVKAGTYRLPYEAEWEYSARAGGKGRYAFGDSEDQLGSYAWYKANANNQTQPVGQKRPNAWGLYDMHGNAYEWVSDWYSESYYQESPADNPQGPNGGAGRVLRGGGWAFSAFDLSVAKRNFWTSSSRNTNIGFRVVKDIE